MSYTIEWDKEAKEDASELEREVRERIVSKLDEIKDFPEHFLKWINKYKIYRLRVGDYRLFIDLDYREEKMTVRAVLHREKAYTGWGD